VPTQDPSERPTTKQRRKRGGSVNRTATKSECSLYHDCERRRIPGVLTTNETPPHTGRKKAGVPEQKDDAQTTNVRTIRFRTNAVFPDADQIVRTALQTPALPSPAPIIDGNHPLPPGATPDKSPNVIQHVKTRDCLDGGAMHHHSICGFADPLAL